MLRVDHEEMLRVLRVLRVLRPAYARIDTLTPFRQIVHTPHTLLEVKEESDNNGTPHLVGGSSDILFTPYLSPLHLITVHGHGKLRGVSPSPHDPVRGRACSE